MAREHLLEAQFESLYTVYYPRILRYLIRLLGDQEQAEDAAQDTFLKAWRHLGKLAPGSNFSSWLYAISRNTALDLLRRRSLVGWQSLQGVDVEDDSQAQRFDELEVALLLQRAFDRLTPRHRQVLTLWHGECRLEQLATLLGTEPSTARNRLSLARRAWRRSFAALTAESQR